MRARILQCHFCIIAVAVHINNNVTPPTACDFTSVAEVRVRHPPHLFNKLAHQCFNVNHSGVLDLNSLFADGEQSSIVPDVVGVAQTALMDATVSPEATQSKNKSRIRRTMSGCNLKLSFGGATTHKLNADACAPALQNVVNFGESIISLLVGIDNLDFGPNPDKFCAHCDWSKIGDLSQSLRRMDVNCRVHEPALHGPVSLQSRWQQQTASGTTAVQAAQDPAPAPSALDLCISDKWDTLGSCCRRAAVANFPVFAGHVPTTVCAASTAGHVSDSCQRCAAGVGSITCDDFSSFDAGMVVDDNLLSAHFVCILSGCCSSCDCCLPDTGI